jgi:uncharacterized membrane protein
VEKIFGLPAHPLLVHLPVILVPAVAVAAIALAFRNDWRRRFGLSLIVASAVSCVAIFLAKESGEGMFHLMREAPSIHRHETLAKVTVVLTGLLFWSIVAMVVAQRRGMAKPRTRMAVGLSTIAVVLALLTIVGTIQTGHEGAKVTWQSGQAGG